MCGRTSDKMLYQRHKSEQAPRSYPPRNRPASENERLYSVAYIYRDQRREVQPPKVVYSSRDGVKSELRETYRPKAGFGTTWSLNQQEPVVRQAKISMFPNSHWDTPNLIFILK